MEATEAGLSDQDGASSRAPNRPCPHCPPSSGCPAWGGARRIRAAEAANQCITRSSDSSSAPGISAPRVYQRPLPGRASGGRSLVGPAAGAVVPVERAGVFRDLVRGGARATGAPALEPRLWTRPQGEGRLPRALGIGVDPIAGELGAGARQADPFARASRGAALDVEVPVPGHPEAAPGGGLDPANAESPSRAGAPRVPVGHSAKGKTSSFRTRACSGRGTAAHVVAEWRT